VPKEAATTIHRVTGYINEKTPEDDGAERAEIELSEQKQEEKYYGQSADIIRYHSGPSEMYTVPLSL
jgi:hypothetical protein